MPSDVLKSTVLVDMITRNNNRISDLNEEIDDPIVSNSVLKEVQAEIGARIADTMRDGKPGNMEIDSRQELDTLMVKHFGPEKAKELAEMLDKTELMLKEKSHASK